MGFTSFPSAQPPADSANCFQGIQELVDASCLQHVPLNYIRPLHKRPFHSQVCHSRPIPIIDLSGLLDGRRRQVIEEIGLACEDWGFFQVINHGVCRTVRERMWKAAYEFFELPAKEKMKFYAGDHGDAVGYVTSFQRSIESVFEWRDSLYLRRDPSTSGDGLKKAPAFCREAAIELLGQMRALADQLCGAIFESQGVESDAFEREMPKLCKESMLLNYYPACPDPSLTLGVGGHSDPGMLTVLMQDEVGGLQVLKDDEWVEVKPVPDALVINVGDQIQILTNGRYTSVEHRAVTNAGKARMSIPCFFSPAVDARIAPLARFVNEKNPALYRETRFGDYSKNFFSRPLDSKSNLDFVASA